MLFRQSLEFVVLRRIEIDRQALFGSHCSLPQCAARCSRIHAFLCLVNNDFPFGDGPRCLPGPALARQALLPFEAVGGEHEFGRVRRQAGDRARSPERLPAPCPGAPLRGARGRRPPAAPRAVPRATPSPSRPIPRAPRRRASPSCRGRHSSRPHPPRGSGTRPAGFGPRENLRPMLIERWTVLALPRRLIQNHRPLAVPPGASGMRRRRAGGHEPAGSPDGPMIR